MRHIAAWLCLLSPHLLVVSQRQFVAIVKKKKKRSRINDKEQQPLGTTNRAASVSEIHRRSSVGVQVSLFDFGDVRAANSPWRWLI